MKVFSREKYLKERGKNSDIDAPHHWSRLADGKPVKDSRVMVNEVSSVDVSDEWIEETEWTDTERYTIKKELEKIDELLYEAWDRLSGLNNTIKGLDLQEEFSIQEIKCELQRFIKEEV
jgi:hypothetical protein